MNNYYCPIHVYYTFDNHYCTRFAKSFSDSSVVLAEPKQYGFLNTLTALNCTTTLDQFRFLIIITWFRGEGDSKMRLGERPRFGSTAIPDEGMYTCEVDITEVGIVIEKKINFKVIGKLNNCFIMILSFLLSCSDAS